MSDPIDDSNLRFMGNGWKHDDEVITTYGSIQLSRYQVARETRQEERARVLAILTQNNIDLPLQVLQLLLEEGTNE